MSKLATIVLVLTTIFCLSCGEKTPLSEDQQIYAGKWMSNDGTWIQIFNNGSGSFELSNSSVSGGNTTISDSTIEIGMMGINSTFVIGAAPFEEDGKWKMKLDGATYVKQ